MKCKKCKWYISCYDCAEYMEEQKRLKENSDGEFEENERNNI